MDERTDEDGNRRDTGRWGEALAARYLEARGWKVLGRNVRVGHKELDLVVRRGRILAFVEVKTRAGTGFGHPFDALTPRKRAEVTACARGWLRENPPPPGSTPRFDAVGIVVDSDGRARIEHLEDAWRAGE